MDLLLKSMLIGSLVLFTASGIGKEQELVVLTSHPESYVYPIKQAFEASYPEVKIRFLFKKTPAAIAHVQQNRVPVPDILLASATDAFEGLKAKYKLKPFSSEPGPYDDPDRFYKGVALAGYVSMWSKSYLEEHQLAPPRTWDELLDPQYERHIAITSPMRSGTMHVIVETILQSYGWEKGWAYLLELSGNLATITARSYGVRDGILKGRFGIGIVIDFFALGAKAKGEQVGYAYFPNTSMLPASAAIIANSRSPKEAELFLSFLTSREGQRLLAHPDIMRLPISQDVLDAFPPDFPNPFDRTRFVKTIEYDTKLSSQRYHLVNVMFDQLISYRLSALNKAWSLLHKLERDLQDSKTQKTLNDVRALLTSVPVGDMMSTDKKFLAQFSHVYPGTSKSTLQKRLEKEWEVQSENATRRAMDLMNAIDINQEVKDQ